MFLNLLLFLFLLNLVTSFKTLKNYQNAAQKLSLHGSINNKTPKTLKSIIKEKLTSTRIPKLLSLFSFYLSSSSSLKAVSTYPIYGADSIMNKKSHGTSDSPVQTKLRWNCDGELADKICNYNRNSAEFPGYWTTTSFLKEVNPNEVVTFYDSVTGKPLFKAPGGRTFAEWKSESMIHGWPSFRVRY
jgi:hypothetical protein